MNNNDDFLVEKQDSDVVWLGIYEGMLCQKRANPADGFKEYVSTNDRSRGKIVYVKHYKKLNAVLTGIDRKDKETRDGKSYPVTQFSFQKGDHKAILEVGATTEFVSRFAKCCENMDLSQPIGISVFLSRENKTAVAFYQNEIKVNPNYNAENRNGLPEWVKDEIQGGWDTREYWQFLYGVLQNVAIPKAMENKANFEMSPMDEPEILEEEFPHFNEDEFATLGTQPPQKQVAFQPQAPFPAVSTNAPQQPAPTQGQSEAFAQQQPQTAPVAPPQPSTTAPFQQNQDMLAAQALSKNVARYPNHFQVGAFKITQTNANEPPTCECKENNLARWMGDPCIHMLALRYFINNETPR